MADDPRARLSEAMMETPLERQARQTLAEMDREQPPPQPENRTGRNLAAAGELAMMALPFTRVGRAMFSTVPRALASTAGLTGAGVAAQHAIAPAEAADGQSAGGDLQTARETIGRLRQSGADLVAAQKQLRDEAKQFDNINLRDTDAVKRAQQAAGTKPDGVWSDKTTAAISAYRAEKNRQADALDTRLTGITRDLETQQQRLNTLEGNQLVTNAENQVGPAHRFVREWGPWAGLAAGVGAGIWSRGRAVKAAAKASEADALAVNAMLPVPGVRAAPAQQRASAVNEFYRQGGAGEAVPFAPAQTARGFKRNAPVASASSLFPPGPSYFRGGDYGVMGAAAGEAGVSGGLLYLAHNELREAEDALAKDKSVANVNRVQRAQDAVAGAETLMRVGLGTIAGRGGAAFKKPYGAGTRPDVARAEREVMAINQLLQRKQKSRR